MVKIDKIKVKDIRIDTKQAYITIESHVVGERYNIALDTMHSNDDVDLRFKSNTKSILELLHMLSLYDNNNNNTDCYLSYYDDDKERRVKTCMPYSEMITHLNLYLLFAYEL